MGGEQPTVLAITQPSGRAEWLLYELQIRAAHLYPNAKITDPRTWRGYPEGYIGIEGLTDDQLVRILEDIDPTWDEDLVQLTLKADVVDHLLAKH